VFREVWKKDRDWLQHDAKANRLWCSLCKAAGASNNFTNFGGTTSVRKDAVTDHEKSNSHTQAVKALRDAGKSTSSLSASASSSSSAATIKQPSAQLYLEKLNADALQTMFKRLQIVYDLANRNRPLSDFKSQVELTQFLGAPGLQLNSAFPENVKYDSETFVNEALSAIAEYLWQQQLKLFAQSPTLSLMFDESTDVANVSELILFVSGEANGEAFTTFADIIPLQRGDAAHISSELLTWLNQSGIDISKFSAIGSDGASTITGENDGALMHAL
jgi:hypothetical protein